MGNCGDINNKSITLVGNPNCGKTTLFNRLTGSKQKVGNWPGVTVERKSGYFSYKASQIEVVDLPGIYSLVQAAEVGALDEKLACDYILNHQENIIVNIVDASHLERHLYLTTQLIEMGVPLILVLNMMDVAKRKHIEIDIPRLANRLNCPVIAMNASNGLGLEKLREAVVSYTKPQLTSLFAYPPILAETIEQLANSLANTLIDTKWLALRLLENDWYVKTLVPAAVLGQAANYQAAISQKLGEDADILLADTRYQFIQKIMASCVKRQAKAPVSWTTYIDKIVLNRVMGIPIFLLMMYSLFVFAINLGGAFQDFFDISSQAIFVDGLAWGLTKLHTPDWLIALLANGLGKGINTTVTFIPVIGAMFLFLSLLEDSGYMARAAFVIDRFMRALGLPGKAFVPMIVGFGCNVPAIMSARTLENKRDRILTIMMSPFMSCGARLAIYAVFSAAFFPQGGQNIVFALYIIGIVMAILTGFLLRKTLLKGEPAPLIMELPAYHLPQMRTLFIHTWQRLKTFIFRAGKLIVPICILIGALNSLNTDGSLNTNEGDTHSLLSLIGQWTTPLFSPMGIKPENWPATVGLVTGVLAKEVVVGTLNTLYSQVGHIPLPSPDSFQFFAMLKAAWLSIPQNLAGLTQAFINPFAAETLELNQPVYGVMYQYFDGRIGAFAYLLFVLLYFPCVSTMAAMLRELHKGWSFFSAVWMIGVAYGIAVLFYQTATWLRHPLSSSLWIFAIAGVFAITLFILHKITKENTSSAIKECYELS